MATLPPPADAPLFESFRVARNKPFLDDEPGRAWQRTLGALMDDSMSRVYEARLAHFPTTAPADGLFYIGAERGVEQCIGESEDDYREVLRTAWELWRIAGSAAVHQYNLGRMGCLNVTVKRRKDFSSPAADPRPYVNAFVRDVWASFDVILQRPLPWDVRYWGSGSWGTGTWGTTATSAQVAQVGRLLQTFRAGHDTPVYVYNLLGSGGIWGLGAWGSGTWGGAGTIVRWLVGEQHWQWRGFI